MDNSFKDNPRNLRARGWMLLNRGDYVAARADLTRALEQPVPDDPYAKQEILRGLAWCAYQIACGQEDLTKLDRAHPNDTTHF